MKDKDYNLNGQHNLPNDNKDKNSFDLPLNYFSEFENNLRKKLEVGEELKEFSILSSIKKNNVFEVPSNYFQVSEQQLELKSELVGCSILQNIKPLTFPALDNDYVKAFQSSIHHKIELSDELKNYTTLYSLDKENGFAVSETYFETFAERVKEKIHQKPEQPISVIDTILDVIFGKKIAFAFGLVTIISLSFYFYSSSEAVIESGNCKTLACLERQDILNNNNTILNFDEDQLIDMVDMNTLNKQVDSEINNTKNQIDKSLIDSITEEDLVDEL